MQRMDKQSTKLLREAVAAALQPVAEKHGLAVEMRGGSYNTSEYLPKVALVIEGENGITEWQREDWNLNCGEFGYGSKHRLMPADLGKQITIGGDSYTIIGQKPRATKRPILLRRDRDGASGYSYSAEGVLQSLMAGENDAEKAERLREKGGRS